MIPDGIVENGRQSRTLPDRGRTRACASFFVALVLCGAAINLLGQGERLLRGRVLSEGVIPPGSVLEILVTTDGIDSGSRLRTYADEDGFFTIRAIPSATYYDVRLEVAGFNPVLERVESAAFSGGIANVVLVLRPTAVIENTTPRQPEGGNRNVIDLAQLDTEISPEAYRLYELALQDAQTGEFARAAGRLERVVELAPRFHEAQNNLGVQYLRLGRLEEAVQAFERAIEFGPNETQARVNLAGIYLEHGEPSGAARGISEGPSAANRAITLLKEAVGLAPHSAEIRLSLGTALYDTGAYGAASAELNHAVELAPDMDPAWLTLINAYTRARRYNDALRVIDQFLERRPDSPQKSSLERIRSQIEALPERRARGTG